MKDYKLLYIPTSQYVKIRYSNHITNKDFLLSNATWVNRNEDNPKRHTYSELGEKSLQSFLNAACFFTYDDSFFKDNPFISKPIIKEEFEWIEING